MNNQAYDDTATRNPRKAYTDYENSTYTVVSKVAYLIGAQIAITSWTPRGKNLGHGWSRRIYP